MDLKDITGFDKFLTPSLIKIVYWIGIVGIIITSLLTIFTAFSYYGGGIRQVFGGIVILVVGLIFWRVICEGIILSFKVYDRLTEIRDRLSQR